VSARAAKVPLNHDTAWRRADWRAGLRRPLLAWFDRNARSLPWRSDPTLYKVWISEIMCQQTQVATVIPYFERFLQRFPDIETLASADESELLQLWEGLGYYRRARSIRAAARRIVELHGGEFPDRFDDVMALPGIGRYTAGAILSIAAGQRLPVVEGNTQRVYSRWIGLRDDPRSTAAKQLLWEFASTMLPRRTPGQFNQAAMELGALICVPRTPHCDRCPVARRCVARREGLQSEIPGKVSSIRYEDRTEFVLLVADAEGNYLVRTMPNQGRWAGLWDFPRTEAASADCAAQWLGRQLGGSVLSGTRLETLKHAVTKYRISLHVHEASLNHEGGWKGGPSLPPEPWQFVSANDLAELPMSVTGRRIASKLTGRGVAPRHSERLRR
jgi:A/G-specific adenine glycosylase